MKRKQVVASFLALAMVAGSVANTAPMSVLAAPIADDEHAVVEESGITLHPGLEDNATITIEAKDMTDDGVTITADRSFYAGAAITGGSISSGSEEDVSKCGTSQNLVVKAEDFSENVTKEYALVATPSALASEAAGNITKFKVNYLSNIKTGILSKGGVATETDVFSAQDLKLNTTSVGLKLSTIGAIVDELRVEVSTEDNLTKSSIDDVYSEGEDGFHNLTLSDGTNYIYAKATNAAGSTCISSAAIEVDATAPEINTFTVAGKDVKGLSQTIATSEPELEVTVDETHPMSIGYAVGGVALTEKNGLADQVYTTLAENGKATLSTIDGDGEYYVYVKAEDTFGNVTYACSKAITVDTTAPAPALSLQTPGAAYISEGKYNITDKHLKVYVTKGAGETITEASVDGNSVSTNSDANGSYISVSEKGKHTIKAVVTRTNGKTASAMKIVECYKTADVRGNTLSKQFSDAFFNDLITGADKENVEMYTIKYLKVEPKAVQPEATEFETSGSNGIPSKVGTYWVQILVRDNEYHYLLPKTVYTKVTINKKSSSEIPYNGVVTVQAGNEEGKKIDVSSTVAAYKSENDTLTYTIASSSDVEKVTASAIGAEVIIKGFGSEDYTGGNVKVTVDGFANYEPITVTIPITVTKAEPIDLEIVAEDKEYDGNNISVKCMANGTEVTAQLVTVGGIALANADTKAVDQYEIEAYYTDGQKVGYNKKTVQVTRRRITVKIADTKVTAGTAQGSVVYPKSFTVTGLVDGHVATASAWSISSAYTAEAVAGQSFNYIGINPSLIKVNDAQKIDVTTNYDITFEYGKVVVVGGQTEEPSKPVTPSTPDPAPSTPAPTTPSTDKPADTKPTDKPADTTPAESNTITTNKDGAQIIVGTDGAPVENKVVIIGNDKYITNDEGAIVKNDFASTAKGNKVFTDADGKIVTDKTIVVDGKKYVAKESGALAASEVVTTAKGNKVYCDATGAVVTDKTIKVDGKKYVAKENGVLAVSEMVTTAKGNKVYCGKTGAIVTGKSFKVDGKRYVASKTGAIVTSKWVKVGDKAYYCDKNGVVTKVKPAKKK